MVKSVFHRWAILFIIILATALRFYGITRRGLWLDEFTSIEISTKALLDILAGVGFNQHTPPLYYCVLHGWFLLFPTSEFSLRVFSVVIDLLNVGLICIVFSHFRSRQSGLLTGVLYAISPYAIYYAQEGRMYTMLVFWVLLSCVITQAWLKRPGLIIESLFIGCATAGLYTHYYFTFFLCTLGASMLWSVRLQRCLVPRLLCVFLIISLLFLPWLQVVHSLVAGDGQTFRKFFLLVVPYTFFRFVAGYGILPLTVSAKLNVSETILSNWYLLAGYCGVFVVIWSRGLINLLGERKSLDRTIQLMPVALMVLPPLLAMVASLISPMLSERYLIVIYPFFLFPLAGFFVEGRQNISKWLGGVALFALIGFSLVQHYGNPAFGNAQWREAGERISSMSLAPQDVYVNPHYVQGVLGYYLKQPFVIRGAEDTCEQTSPDINGTAGFWLVESGAAESFLGKCLKLGFHVRYEEYFPLENGIRTFYLEKD